MQYAQFGQYHEFYVPASRCVLLVGGSVINGWADGAVIRPPAVLTRPPTPVDRWHGRWVGGTFSDSQTNPIPKPNP